MEQITFNPNNEPYYSEDFIKGFKCGAQRQFEADVTDRRKDAPSIDIVFCKECRWGNPYSDKQLECDALGLGGLKFPDDFCSCGERSGQ